MHGTGRVPFRTLILALAVAAGFVTSPVPAAPQQSAAAASGDAGVALLEAAGRGDIEAIRRYIQAGADLNVREPVGGSTPLIIAASFGHPDLARALIDGGADIEVRNNDGTTALIAAALFAHPDIVRTLLDAGADRSIRNNYGATALDVVAAPFEQMRSIYDMLGEMLAPAGLTLDYDRIREARPVIEGMLRGTEAR